MISAPSLNIFVLILSRPIALLTLSNFKLFSTNSVEKLESEKLASVLRESDSFCSEPRRGHGDSNCKYWNLIGYCTPYLSGDK